MKDTRVIKEKVQIARDILVYLSKHPDAQDTLEGIVEWWLLEQMIARHMTAVKEALAELVDRELVIEIKSADSRIRYRSNGEKHREIKAMVDERHRTAVKRKNGERNRVMAGEHPRGKQRGSAEKQLLEKKQNQP
ncbi:MAG: hypothetical protein A4E65_03609 [Syntrophorhabdus sp. PtaU1.Bin153]|nr:MAG: hypothetical protein A4E65_03609 [Syntrophorhabdus sp. PtaU1.Bin153]